ncbi:hypothetical protein FB451DRAFT_1171077 [Mycena latifolia]|nr:hypothetical protein FB451DRAFT_1171077 [Mycena latifolia]
MSLAVRPGGRRAHGTVLKAYRVLSEAGKQRLREEALESETWEELAECTIANREATRQELEEFWVESEDRDGDLWSQPVEVLTGKNAPLPLAEWLSMKVELTQPQAKRALRGMTHIAYITLKGWRMSVSRVVSKQVPNGQKMLNDELYLALVHHAGFLTQKYNLECLAPRKQFCGRNEVRLLTEAMYAQATDREWVLQTDCALKLTFCCGWRPGSLGPASDRYLQEGRYLKWKDVLIVCEGYASFHTRIENTALKGYNQIAAKRPVFARQPDNVIFDVAPPLLLLALERKGIKGIKNVEDLLKSRNAKIEWEDWFMDKPVMLAGKIGGHAGCQTGVPIRSAGITDMIQMIAARVGIDMTGYDLRRNFGDEVDNIYGETGAQTGLTHTSTSTYKRSYGREAANLDVAGSVMHEAIVGRHSLNQFESPAFSPSVGLSEGTVQQLQELKGRAPGNFKINGMPVQLKRSADAMITPYARPQAPASTASSSIDDAACEAHPAWKEFIEETQWKARAAQIDALSQKIDNALARLAPSMKYGTQEAQLTRGYPNNPDLLTAHVEHRRLYGVQMAARNRKLQSIRVYLSQVAGETTTPATGDNDADTYIARDVRAAQFSAPSALLDIAIRHAPLAKLLSADSPASAESDEAPPLHPVSTTSTSSHGDDDVRLEQLIDPNFVAFDEGDPKEMDVDELPAWIVRAGYMRLLAACGKEVHSTCPKCQVDPTVDDDDRSVVWTPWKLERHIRQFHTVALQTLRWYKKHQACFLCAMDGEVVCFGSRSTYGRHMNPTKGFHSDDARLRQEPAPTEIPIAMPDSFPSPETLREKDDEWRAILERITIPSTFLDSSEMEDVVAGASAEAVDPCWITRGIDARQVTLSFKRLKLSKCGFKFVGIANE